MNNLNYKRILLWTTGAVGAALLMDKPAIAAPILQDVSLSNGTSIWSVLLPLATASIGVERATEIIWNYVEFFILFSKRWIPANLKTAQYIKFKSGTSMLLGIIIGILISNFTGMQLFSYLTSISAFGFLQDFPEVWDVLVTGLIIGSGAKPAHEILGIITQLKHFLGNAAIMQRESAGAALAEGVLRLAESESKMMVDVPGVGPSRLPSPQSAMAPGSLESMGEGEDGAELAPSRTARYVEILRNATAQ